MGEKPDPVVAYTQSLQEKMNTELAQFKLDEEARIKKLIADQEAKALADKLQAEKVALAEELAKQTALAEAQKIEAEKAYQEQLKNSATMQNTNAVLNISNSSVDSNSPKNVQSATTAKKSSALPIVAGVGILALLTLGKE